MRLSESRAKELSEVIEELVAGGDVAAIESASPAVQLECARRFLAREIRQRGRTSERNREQYAKVRADVKVRYRAKVRAVTEQMRDELRREWSAELLAGKFSLPDGVQVSWADATAAQHELRADQLEGLAAGDLLTASIHRQAIADIRSAGVGSLGEVPRG
jgi:hypothetical protein